MAMREHMARGTHRHPLHGLDVLSKITTPYNEAMKSAGLFLKELLPLR